MEEIIKIMTDVAKIITKTTERYEVITLMTEIMTGMNKFWNNWNND